MSRQWRIEYEGALHHVLSRGNGRQEIFFDDADRTQFIGLMGETSERFDLDFYAYVLMGNHYHFLLKTKRANLSKSMQWFGATYTRRFNNRHKRGGHLFQGRFKNFLVENDNYLFRLSCYIHRNPLRAEIVTRLADYKWSSYASYAYGKRKHGWLNTDPILSQFGGSSKVKREKYRSKVQNYSGEEKNCGKISDMVLSWAQPVLWMRSARNIFRTNFTRRNPNSGN
jgi:putative transposase